MTRSESSKGSVTGSTSGSTNGYPLPTTVGVTNHDPTKHRAPSYTFGARLTERTRPTPGPQYKVEGSLTSRGPSYSITGRPRRSMFDLLSVNSGPGPNAYMVPPMAHTSLERRAPMYSLGLPYHSNSTRYGSYAAPAPNTYTLPSTLGSRVPHVRGGPASTLHGKGSNTKSFSFDHAKTPGPAGYAAVDPRLTTKRSPAVRLTGRGKLPPLKFVTPGPGAYDLRQSGASVSKSSPRFSMGVKHGENVRPFFTLADVSD